MVPSKGKWVPPRSPNRLRFSRLPKSIKSRRREPIPILHSGEWSTASLLAPRSGEPIPKVGNVGLAFFVTVTETSQRGDALRLRKSVCPALQEAKWVSGAYETSERSDVLRKAKWDARPISLLDPPPRSPPLFGIARMSVTKLLSPPF